MKNLINYIQEGLKVSSKSKFGKKSEPIDYSKVNTSKISHVFMGCKYADMLRNQRKMKEYFDKKSNPQRLVKSIRDQEKLVIRWRLAIELGWPDCAVEFRNAIIDRKIFDEMTLNAYVFHVYESMKDGRARPYISTGTYKDYEVYMNAIYMDY